jgi:uncharacterized membrane protein HdeD (DUF308 family)
MSNPGFAAPAGGRDRLSDELADLARLWPLLLLSGVASAVVGVLLLVWPSRTIDVIAILLGIELLLLGAIQIGLAVAESEGSRTGALLRGAFAVIAGLVVIRHPGDSLTVIALAVGVYLVLAGVIKFVSAFEASVGLGWLLVGGLLDVAIGVVIVAWPHFGLSSFAVLVGICLVMRGIGEGASSFSLRSIDKELRANVR